MPAIERYPAPADDVVTTDMLNAYFRDGFLVLDNFAAPDACDLVSERIDELIAAFEPSTVREVFGAADKAEAAATYFRESGDKMRFFFGPGSFDDDGNLVKDKERAITSIGYAIHDLDPLFDGFSRDPSLGAVAKGLGMADPVLIQSQVLLHQPHTEGPAEVALHQDATFLYTQPESLMGFWLALDDIDGESGGIVALSGQHRSGLRERFRYVGDELQMMQLNQVHWNHAAARAIDAPKGTLVLLSGLVPYYISPNRSTRPRRSYLFHVYDRTARWAPDNWLRRSPNMPLVGFD